ncbi:molybdate ABC transporter permease subunit [Oceanobacillus massiliensis]|uniref:molybdate ABC transporter permease subunit n=1 Tax=Oceanobacillus massiliensis TaxID=1465765 RepID=UPI0002883963|nr:molybdate ABC transporter permease subunit [Oceanobacillus massiliensis]
MEWSWFPVQLSVIVAVSSLVVNLLLSIVAVYWLVVKNVKGRAVIETIFFMPLVLPPTVIGFMLIIVFGSNSFIGNLLELITGRSLLFTVTAAVIAAAVVAYPLMYQSIKTGVQSVDSNILGAAKVDGANDWKLLTRIILPLSGRAILTGLALSFTRAFGEFGATLMFAGNIPGKTQTVPTAIYLAIESGRTEIAWLYVLISIGFSFILLLLINQLRGNR